MQDGEHRLRDLLRAQDPQAQTRLLRKQVRQLERQNERLRNVLAGQEEFAAEVSAAVVAAKPLPPLRRTAPAVDGASVTAVLKLSDWHIGEVTQAKETEGFGRYNYRIAQSRIYGIVDDFLKWVQVLRKAYRIDEIAVLCEGDYVSGDIHAELLATNEFPLPEQTAKAGLLLGEVLRILAGNCKRLQVSMVGADNHGRLQKKPQAKQKSSNNMSFLVHQLAMTHTAQCRNVRFQVATAAKQVVRINGWNVLSEHGDVIRGVLGIPYYGFQRMIGKEATRRMGTAKYFDLHSIGHFHVPAIIESRTIVNGSLNGTTEFDHVCGRHALPCQVAFLMHPEHGVFNWVPFKGEV